MTINSSLVLVQAYDLHYLIEHAVVRNDLTELRRAIIPLSCLTFIFVSRFKYVFLTTISLFVYKSIIYNLLFVHINVLLLLIVCYMYLAAYEICILFS